MEPVAILSARNLLFYESLYNIHLWKLSHFLISYTVWIYYFLYVIYEFWVFLCLWCKCLHSFNLSSCSFSSVLSLPWLCFPLLPPCHTFTVFSRIHLSWGKKLSTFSAFPLNIHFSYCPQLNLGSLKRILLLLWFSLSCTSQTAILGSWLLHLSVKPPASLRSGLTHCQFSWLLLGTTSWDSPVHILMYPYASSPPASLSPFNTFTPPLITVTTSAPHCSHFSPYPV